MISLFYTFLKANSGVAVMAVGIQGFQGHGVHGIRPNQWFNIFDVAVGGVFGASAGPEELLSASALGNKSAEAFAGEDLFIYLISHFSTGYSDLPAQAGCHLGPCSAGL